MNKLALLTAAGAALLMMAGAALAQNSDQPSTIGASRSHMDNPQPSSSGPSNPNAPATDRRYNPDQPSPPATSSGGSVSTDPTNQNPRANVK